MSEASPTSDSWLVASNVNTFDSDGAFKVHREIDWSETASAHINDGDIVYLYGTAPVSAITHQCQVIETAFRLSE